LFLLLHLFTPVVKAIAAHFTLSSFSTSTFQRAVMVPRWHPSKLVPLAYSRVDTDESQSDTTSPFLEKPPTQLTKERKWPGVNNIALGAVLGFIISILVFLAFSTITRDNEREIYHSPVPECKVKQQRAIS
jgi:hypothetical protein